MNDKRRNCVTDKILISLFTMKSQVFRIIENDAIIQYPDKLFRA